MKNEDQPTGKMSPVLEKRFDYSALALAAATLCYPFLLKAFHALVGAPAATPSPFAILGAVLVLAVAFVVPFLGLAFALRPTASPGARRARRRTSRARPPRRGASAASGPGTPRGCLRRTGRGPCRASR